MGTLVVLLSRLRRAVVLAALCLLALPAAAPGAARGDFNGDGFVDLAVGVPHDAVRLMRLVRIPGAGAVNVIHGSASGLTATGDQIWTQSSAGILDQAETDDGFGFALAAGDFNGDGFSDLAVGVPNEDLGDVGNAGAVHVIYGSAAGLTSSGNQVLSQSTPALVNANWTSPGTPAPPPEAPEAEDQFGYAVAAGDSNGDGYDDLAVGAPGENGGDGYFAVLYGSAGGIQEAAGTGHARAFHYFSLPLPRAGSALALGDIDGSGQDELVVGMPAGNNVYVYTEPWGYVTTTIAGWGNGDGELGYSLAVGDFDNDGFADIAMGAPATNPGGGAPDGGGFRVCYGPTIASGADCPDRTLPLLHTGDRFGSSLAAGDLDNDGNDDLAIGAPLDDIGGKNSAGSVFVAFGTASGLASTYQKWHQNRRGVADDSEASDKFGASVAILDFNGNGRGELAVGVPGETLGVYTRSPRIGMVQVFTGISDGLARVGNRRWHQETEGILGVGARGDAFGASLGR